MDTWEGSSFPPLTLPLAFPQSLVEAAEEADLNHEFNESLVVSPAPQAWEV